MRDEQLRARGSVVTPWADFAHDADDLRVDVSPEHDGQGHAPADRVRIRPVLLRQRLVDYDHGRLLRVVTRVEPAARP